MNKEKGKRRREMYKQNSSVSECQSVVQQVPSRKAMAYVHDEVAAENGTLDHLARAKLQGLIINGEKLKKLDSLHRRSWLLLPLRKMQSWLETNVNIDSNS